MQFFRIGALLVAFTASVPQLSAQTLKLIPLPREARAAAAQSLANGLQISCVAPCAPEDTFAIDDLKTYLATANVEVNTTSPVNILITRYGSPNSKSIYNDSLPKAQPRQPTCRRP